MTLVDANVLLRFLTKAPPDMAEASRQLLKRGQRGEVELRVVPLTLAEVFYVLRRFYKWELDDIQQRLIALVTSRAFEVEYEAAVLQALQTLAKGVDFEDAYLAARVATEGQVASFDRDFDKLGVARLDPLRDSP